MRLCLATFAVLLALAAPAAAANDPVRLWSVSEVQQGAGEVRVRGGSQVGGRLFETAELGNTVFNLPLGRPYWDSLPRDRAFGALFSSADGAQYSVLAQAPSLNRFRAHAAKGGVTHLDEYQAYEKRASDASLKITLSDVFLNAIDDNNRAGAFECPPDIGCEPIRTVVHFHARAYAASAGGDFFDAGGVAYLQGHQHSWRPGAATSADSPGPLWGEAQFDVDGDADGSETGAEGSMFLKKPRSLKIPLASVRPGELFAVHVSLEAEAVDDAGGESAAEAFIQDPQHLLSARGLDARGKPRFKEPAARGLKPVVHCASTHSAGVLQLSAPSFEASESSSSPMVLVTRGGGSRGSASVTLSAHSGSARAGRDFKPTSTTVRFGDGDTSPRLVEIPLREDGDVEPAERFTVQLGDARCGKLGSPRRATVTILDDDAVPTPAPAPAPSAMPAPTPSPSPPPTGLDRTFGADGRVSTPVGGLGHGEAVVLQPDGTIVTAGTAGSDFAVTFHDAAGNLKNVVTTDIGPNDAAFDAAPLPGGGVVAVGRTDAAGAVNQDFAVVRYGPGGTPALVTKTDFFGHGDEANAVAVQPDGKIVVAGSAVHTGSDGDFAIARYKTDGTLDPSFDGDGKVTSDLGTGSDSANSVAIQPDGAIVVAGMAGDATALVRYTPTGEPDSTFGTGGVKLGGLGLTAVARGVAVTPDGKIELAGYTVGPHNDRDFLLARYDTHGNLLGSVSTDIGGGDDYAEDLVVDSSGRTIVVGRATSPTILDMALVRYTPELTLDPSFDGDGIVTADFHGRGEFGEDVALDAAGRIVAAGYTANGSDTDFALVRANP